MTCPPKIRKTRPFLRWVTTTNVTNEILLEAEALLLPKVIEGDYKRITQFLSILSASIKQGVPLTPKLADFLSTALREIAEGEDPQSAFKINRKRGEKDTLRALEKDVLLAANVARLKIVKNISIPNAIADTACSLKVSKETVKAAWKKYKQQIKVSKENPRVCFVLFDKKSENLQG